MLIESLILACILVKILNGNFKKIIEYRGKSLKKSSLLFFCLGLIFFIIYKIAIYKFINNEIFCRNSYMIAVSLISVGFLINFENPGFDIIGIGSFLNLIPMKLNGKMPVSYDALLATKDEMQIKCILNGNSLFHGIFKNPKAEIFSDIISLKPPYYNPKVISIGDILINIGIIVTIIYISKVGE